MATAEDSAGIAEPLPLRTVHETNN